jgi:sulfur-oxidizing protein SoxY
MAGSNGRAGAAAIVAAIIAITASTSAIAGSAFDGFKSDIFGPRAINDGRGIVAIKAPYRPDDVRAVPFEVDARLSDGRTIRAVTFIVDNNPSPVVAAFKLGPGREKVALAIKFRLNQQSDIRAVVEASDGQLYMTTQLVKFAGGQAACSAPPSAPPDEIARNMGKMNLAEAAPAGQAKSVSPRLKLQLSHPNHTGMVLDQQTLLYTPLRMVQQMVVRQGRDVVFDMEGSIGLNENPIIEFDVARNGADELTVEAMDTDGARFARAFPLGPNS